MNIPHSPEIERAVLGSFLLEPGLLKKGGLLEGDFHNGAFRRIFRAMEGLFRREQGFDLPLLCDHLTHEDFELLNQVSGEAFTTTNFPSHVSRLKELSAKRTLQALCFQAVGEIPEGELDRVLLRLRQGLSEILAGQGAEGISGAGLAAGGWQRIEDRAKRRGALSGVPCGLRLLDDHLDGFQESEFTILAARPSVGKTAFALHCLLTAAQAGFPGAFLSLEMGRGQITDRLHATLSGVPLWKIRKGILGPEDWQRITAASSILNALPVRFSFGCRSLKDVVSTIMAQVENHQVKIVFADYLQLIKAESAQNREREISMISGELKALAVSLRVPIVALSQLNRGPEKREDRRPGLADLRDSGSLEQDADNVILLFREGISEAKGKIEFIVAKGRNIGVGTFKATFDGETQTFSED